jgi:hypothetical protein
MCILDGGFMTNRIVALWCCLSIVQSSAVMADVPERPHEAERMATASFAVPAASSTRTPRFQEPGPLLKASTSNESYKILRAEARVMRSKQDQGISKRSWVERHPVWTGALIGFGVGSLLTYAATHDSDKGELLKVISPGAAALFWGGVSAGVGALAGWSIGRNRDDDDDTGS